MATSRRNEPRDAKDASVARSLATSPGEGSGKRQRRGDIEGAVKPLGGDQRTKMRKLNPATQSVKGKKKRLRRCSSEGEDDADEELDGDERPAKRTVWDAEESALLQEVWREVVETQKRPHEAAKVEYCKRAKKAGLPPMTLAACRKKMKGGTGHSSEYHWEPEQVILLDTIKKKNLSPHDAYAEYKAGVAALGGKLRSERGMREKLYAMTEQTVQEARESLAVSAMDGETAVTGTRNTGGRASRATGKKFEWAPEEDKIVCKLLKNTVNLDAAAAACRQELVAVDEADGPRIDRTEYAIKKRYADLRKKRVLTVRRARRWTKKDDQYLMTQIQAVQGDEAKEEETMKTIAKRLDVRPNFVRRRLSWMKVKSGRRDIQSTSHEEEENVLEERQLQGRASTGRLRVIQPVEEELEVAAGGEPSLPPTPREGEVTASRSIYDDSEMWEALRLAVHVMADAETVDEEASEIPDIAAEVPRDLTSTTDDAADVDPEQLLMENLAGLPVGRMDVLIALAAVEGEGAPSADVSGATASVERDSTNADEALEGINGQGATSPASEALGSDVGVTVRLQGADDDAPMEMGQEPDELAGSEEDGEDQRSASPEGERLTAVGSQVSDAPRTPTLMEAVESPWKDIESAVQYHELAQWLREGCEEDVVPDANKSRYTSQDAEAEPDEAVDAGIESRSELGEDERSSVSESFDDNTIDVRSDSEDGEPDGVVVDREVVYLTDKGPSEANTVPSDDEARSDDELEDQSPRAMGMSDDEDEERARWKEEMKSRLLTFLDDTMQHRSAQPWNLDRYREYLNAKSSAGKGIQETLDYEAWCSKEDANHYETLLLCLNNPRLSRRRVRLLLFVLALLRPDRDMTEMFLRELRAGSYGVCRSGVCGLSYDWDHPDYVQFKGCRHWEYYFHREVYFDDFADEGDYRLAAAQAIHFEAREATCDYAWKAPKKGWSYHRLELCGYGPLVESFKVWPDQARFIHALCAFGTMSSVRVSAAYVEETEEEINWCHGTCGQLFFGDEDDSGRAAMLLQLDGSWVFVCRASPMRIRDHASEVSWRPMTEIKQQLDRFSAVDRFNRDPTPIIAKLAARDYSLEDRGGVTLLGAAVQQFYRGAKSFLNQDQARVLDTLLQKKGIIMNRGPYGCGKTTVIATCAVMYAMAYPGERVLIVSETNAAIDEDLSRIIGMGVLQSDEVLRVGRLRERMEGHRDNYLESRIEDKRQELEEQGVGRKAVAQELGSLKRRLLTRAKIVIATLGQMAKRWLQEEKFHVVINDEGGQTLETSLYQVFSPMVHTLLVVGDERQLRGYSRLSEQVRDYYDGGRRPHKITWSVLHAMIDKAQRRVRDEGRTYRDDADFPGITVHTEFRSNKRITSFLDVFYDYPLDCQARESAEYLGRMVLPATNEDEELGSERVVWYGLEEAELTFPQVENYPGLLMGIELLLRIKATLKRQRFIGRKSVFMITPYAAQVALFKRMVRDLQYLWANYLEVDVMTTDSSQGREAEIVIASMVRQTTMGFLKGYPARALVTLSRVKDYLFVLAKWRPFRDDEKWNRLRDRARELGVDYRRVG